MRTSPARPPHIPPTSVPVGGIPLSPPDLEAAVVLVPGGPPEVGLPATKPTPSELEAGVEPVVDPASVDWLVLGADVMLVIRVVGVEEVPKLKKAKELVDVADELVTVAVPDVLEALRLADIESEADSAEEDDAVVVEELDEDVVALIVEFVLENVATDGD